MSSPESLTSNRPYRSGRLHAGTVIFFLAAYVAVSLLSIFSSLLQRSVFTSMVAGGDASTTQVMGAGALEVGTFLLHILVYVACIVAFCFWMHRAYSNLRALGNPPSSLEYSPGWAVGFFFIPFANLVVPYRAVKEIWVKSDPRVRTKDDFMHAPPTSTGLILAWWLTWIGSNVLLNVSGRLYDRTEDPSTLAWVADLTIIATAARIVAAVLAILVVRGINRRQEERSRHVRYAPVAPPPPPLFTQPAPAPGTGFNPQ